MMSATTFHQGLSAEVATAVRRELLKLAYAEDQRPPTRRPRSTTGNPAPPRSWVIGLPPRSSGQRADLVAA